MRSCLTFLATVKKRLVLSDAVFVAWGSALRDIPDDLGRIAFSKVMRETQYGDVEPGHVIAAAEAVRQEKATALGGSEPWISEARKFWGEVDHENPSEEFRKWKLEEATKNYRALNASTGEIMLIQNPDSWQLRTEESGRSFYIKRSPQGTGQFIKKQSSGRSNNY